MDGIWSQEEESAIGIERGDVNVARGVQEGAEVYP